MGKLFHRAAVSWGHPPVIFKKWKLDKEIILIPLFGVKPNIQQQHPILQKSSEKVKKNASPHMLMIN